MTHYPVYTSIISVLSLIAILSCLWLLSPQQRPMCSVVKAHTCYPPADTLTTSYLESLMTDGIFSILYPVSPQQTTLPTLPTTWTSPLFSSVSTTAHVISFPALIDLTLLVLFCILWGILQAPLFYSSTLFRPQHYTTPNRLNPHVWFSPDDTVPDEYLPCSWDTTSVWPN